MVSKSVTYKYYLNDALKKGIPFYTAGKAGVGGGWWKNNTPDPFKMHNVCYSFLRKKCSNVMGLYAVEVIPSCLF